MTYTPEHLHLWEHPRNYGGATWEDWYSAGVGCSRDSDPLEQSNFDAMCLLLSISEVDPGDPTALIDIDLPRTIPTTSWWLTRDYTDGRVPSCLIVHEGHWAVGWAEWIAIHKSDFDRLRIADAAIARLRNYPILDESRYFLYEDRACSDTWASMSPSDRLSYLRNHNAHLSFRALRAAVNGSWPDAANLLPCPSDLIH